MLLHLVIYSPYRIINHGIFICKLFLPCNWSFGLVLDFLYERSGFAVHWLGPCKILEFLVPLGFVADGPSLPLETDRSQADRVPVNQVALG